MACGSRHWQRRDFLSQFAASAVALSYRRAAPFAGVGSPSALSVAQIRWSMRVLFPAAQPFVNPAMVEVATPFN